MSKSEGLILVLILKSRSVILGFKSQASKSRWDRKNESAKVKSEGPNLRKCHPEQDRGAIFEGLSFLLSSETNIKIFNFADPTFFFIATNFLFSSAPFQKIKVKLYMIRGSFFSIKWFFRTHFFGRSNTFLSFRYGFFESFLNFRGRFFKNQKQTLLLYYSLTSVTE